MTTRLEGHTAIVTGAADGIGCAIATLFTAEGARVCVADVDEEKGSSFVRQLTEQGRQAIFVRTDVSDQNSVEQMVQKTAEWFGPPTILINNAGIIEVSDDPLQHSAAEWDRIFGVNVAGMWNCCRSVLPLMKQSGAGSIVNLGSVHSFKIVPGHFPYAVTKHAVVGLTRNLAVDFGQYGIRVNALCPGMVETPMAFKYWERMDDPAAARKTMADLHPLGRNASTEEIAYPTLFLASDESSFMTGQCLIVDGGRSVVYHD